MSWSMGFPGSTMPPQWTSEQELKGVPIRHHLDSSLLILVLMVQNMRLNLRQPLRHTEGAVILKMEPTFKTYRRTIAIKIGIRSLRAM
mmetsp:Transcript_8283/g.12940  ORF Transcript_8283/g.12940 Transcript_8283/m.12940 type:complete len:88 (+) Transcript_8283:902-1165(+)